MNPFEVKRALSTMTILCDTREQNTQRARKRLEQIGTPIERVALKFGDYSIKCDVVDLRNRVALERKMSLDEIAHCYCQDRKRFEREFERAKDARAKLYLLIENGSLDEAYEGHYRSRVHPSSLTASMFAWLARYNCQILFCDESNSGKVIHDVLYRELKEYLEAMPDENSGRDTQRSYNAASG